MFGANLNLGDDRLSCHRRGRVDLSMASSWCIEVAISFVHRRLRKPWRMLSRQQSLLDRGCSVFIVNAMFPELQLEIRNTIFKAVDVAGRKGVSSHTKIRLLDPTFEEPVSWLRHRNRNTRPQQAHTSDISTRSSDTLMCMTELDIEEDEMHTGSFWSHRFFFCRQRMQAVVFALATGAGRLLVT